MNHNFFIPQKKQCFLFIFLFIFLNSYTQTQYDSKINELGIGPYTFSGYAAKDLSLASGDFGNIEFYNHVNSRFRFGHLPANNNPYGSQTLIFNYRSDHRWKSNNYQNPCNYYSSLRIGSYDDIGVFGNTINKLNKATVLFAFENSVGGIIQDPDSNMYGDDFDVYVFNETTGEQIGFFSSQGKDVNGINFQPGTTEYYYYNDVYLDTSIKLPTSTASSIEVYGQYESGGSTYTLSSKRWGVSYPTQQPGSVIKVVFDFKADWWMNDLYSGQKYYWCHNQTFTPNDGIIPKGFVVSATVSDNGFLPYIKYNPWNDELWGIAQTGGYARIKDNSSNSILVEDIFTGSNLYNLPIANWNFSSTISNTFVDNNLNLDKEVIIETKRSSSDDYSTDKKSMVFSSNFNDFTLSQGQTIINSTLDETLTQNIKRGSQNLTYDHVNRFSFDRIGSATSLNQYYYSFGDPDKFWTSTNLTSYKNSQVIENNQGLIPTTIDETWMLPVSKMNLPIKRETTTFDLQKWYGDIRDTDSGPSLKNYKPTSYIGINKTYNKETGQFIPYDRPFYDGETTIQGLGPSEIVINSNWTYNNSNISFDKNISFNVYGLRALVNYPGVANNANIDNVFYGQSVESALRPWPSILISNMQADSPVSTTDFADPLALKNSFAFGVDSENPNLDFRENIYLNHLELTEPIGTYKQLEYGGENLYPDTEEGVSSFPYEPWKRAFNWDNTSDVYSDDTSPFRPAFQVPMPQSVIDLYSKTDNLIYFNPNPANFTREGLGLDIYDNLRNYAIRTSLPYKPQAGKKVVYDIVVGSTTKPDDTNAVLDTDFYVYNANTSTHLNPSRQLEFDENNWDEGLFVSFWRKPNDTWEGQIESVSLADRIFVPFSYVINTELTTDENYLGVSPLNDRLELSDDDKPGLHLDVNVENFSNNTSPYTMVIAEGETVVNAARIKLTAKPYRDVIVLFEIPQDGSQTYFDPISSMTFTPDNWNVFQDFDVTCKQDLLIQGNKTYRIKVKFSNPEAFHLSNTTVFNEDYAEYFNFKVINDDVPEVLVQLENNNNFEDFSSLSLYEGGLTDATPIGPTQANVAVSLVTPLSPGEEVFYNIYVADTNGTKNDALYKDLSTSRPYVFEVAAGVSNPKWTDTDGDGWRDFQEDRDKDGKYNASSRLVDDYSNFNDPTNTTTVPDDPNLVKIENHKLVAQLTFNDQNYNIPQLIPIIAVEDGIVDGDQTIGLFFDIDVRTKNDYDDVPLIQKELIILDSNTPDLDLDDILDQEDLDDDGDGCPDTEDQLPRDSTSCGDFDNDGISNQIDDDDDGDGFLDTFEIENGTDPLNICSFPSNAQNNWPANFSSLAQLENFMALDCDGDGYTNSQEFFNKASFTTSLQELFQQNALSNDFSNVSYLTDFCVIPASQTNPDFPLIQGQTSSEWQAEDCDGDGQTNQEEMDEGSSPYDADTDKDGVLDPVDQCDNSPLGANVNELGCSLIARWADNYNVNYNESDGTYTTTFYLEVSGQNITESKTLKFQNPYEDRITISDGGDGVFSFSQNNWLFTIPVGIQHNTSSFFSFVKNSIPFILDIFKSNRIKSGMFFLVFRILKAFSPFFAFVIL